MRITRRIALAAGLIACMGVLWSSIALAGGPPVKPLSNGSTNVYAGAGTYNSTSSQYSNYWAWFVLSDYCQGSQTDHYYWYLYRSSGVLQTSGSTSTCDYLTTGPHPFNTYYWKVYNHTGDHSSHTLGWWVCWSDDGPPC